MAVEPKGRCLLELFSNPSCGQWIRSHTSVGIWGGLLVMAARWTDGKCRGTQWPQRLEVRHGSQQCINYLPQCCKIGRMSVAGVLNYDCTNSSFIEHEKEGIVSTSNASREVNHARRLILYNYATLRSRGLLDGMQHNSRRLCWLFSMPCCKGVGDGRSEHWHKKTIRNTRKHTHTHTHTHTRM